MSEDGERAGGRLRVTQFLSRYPRHREDRRHNPQPSSLRRPHAAVGHRRWVHVRCRGFDELIVWCPLTSCGLRRLNDVVDVVVLLFRLSCAVSTAPSQPAADRAAIASLSFDGEPLPMTTAPIDSSTQHIATGHSPPPAAAARTPPPRFEVSAVVCAIKGLARQPPLH